jgi:hypothetical protein
VGSTRAAHSSVSASSLVRRRGRSRAQSCARWLHGGNPRPGRDYTLLGEVRPWTAMPHLRCADRPLSSRTRGPDAETGRRTPRLPGDLAARVGTGLSLRPPSRRRDAGTSERSRLHLPGIPRAAMSGKVGREMRRSLRIGSAAVVTAAVWIWATLRRAQGIRRLWRRGRGRGPSNTGRRYVFGAISRETFEAAMRKAGRRRSRTGRT